jgi:hypothetical protein
MKGFQTIRASFSPASLYGKDGSSWIDPIERDSEKAFRKKNRENAGSAERLYPLKPKNPI